MRSHIRSPFPLLPAVGLTLALAACQSGGGKSFDWDLRRSGLSTAEAARSASQNRPTPDARGVISYPGYQVAVAQRGDTVGSLAARVGVDPAELSRYNATKPEAPLRDGEVLALPRRVAETAGGSTTGGTGAVVGAPIRAGAIDVTTIASTAINRAAPTAATAPAATPASGWQKGPEAASQAPGVEPARHQVQRGETAFTIARTYNVTARDLADWNGLDANLTVREGQYLLIPVTLAAAPTETMAVTPPGAGSPTPVPPSASEPLPEKDEAPNPVAQGADGASAPKPVVDLGANRTAASASKLAMPVGGSVIRGYSKGKNDGIDIGASAGATVTAAEAGTVAAITKSTDGVPILVIRHSGNLLTVYGGIDALSVEKGATVTRGQAIAKVRAGSPSFLHFEVRQGFDSVDPMSYLQ